MRLVEESVITAAPKPFVVKDCALAAIATGKKAQNLRELREILVDVDPASVYYHFWGGLLRPRFDDPLYHNDFAIWASFRLQDAVLAQRLGVIDPLDFKDLEALREELIDVIESRLDEVDYVPWTKSEHQFHFIKSQIVVFEAGVKLDNPAQLAEALPRMAPSSIFYHYIDSRRRSEKGWDDFSTWLTECFPEMDSLLTALSRVHPFFAGLTEMRDKLSVLFRRELEVAR